MYQGYGSNYGPPYPNYGSTYPSPYPQTAVAAGQYPRYDHGYISSQQQQQQQQPPQATENYYAGYDDPRDPRISPTLATDPNEFRRHMMYELSKLTFNSKPIITDLTLFAHQHMLRMAPVISSCLEEHLRSCHPSYRLPAFYLLDSISKNIGPPYINLFSRFIERVFLAAYHVVDGPTKGKMEQLLGTWRTGGPDGGELFRQHDEGRDGRVQRGIETALFGSGGRGGGAGGGGRGLRDSELYQSGIQQISASATAAERSGVLLDVRRLLQFRREQATENPEDAVNRSQLSALHELERLILESPLTSDQVRRVREQVAVLAPQGMDFSLSLQSQPPENATFSHVSPPPPSSLNEGSLSYHSPATYQTVLSDIAGAPSTVAAGGAGTGAGVNASTQHSPQVKPSDFDSSLGIGNNLNGSQTTGEIKSTPTSDSPRQSQLHPQHHSGIDHNLLAQLQTLRARGDLSELLAAVASTHTNSNTTTTTPHSSTSTGNSSTVVPPPNDEHSEFVDTLRKDYDDDAIALNIQLTSADLLKSRTTAVSFLYGRFGLQCKQCGIRFFDNAKGKAEMDVHLDWHFTHKRRIRESAGRAQGRSWFSYEEDWMRSDDIDMLSERAETNHVGSSATTTTTSKLLTKANRLELMARKVPAPSDPDQVGKGCPICKEQFEEEWSEPDEGWVYCNAVLVDGIIYHATCHSEASQSKLNTRLRLESSSRPSRETTPVPLTIAPPPPAHAEKKASSPPTIAKDEENEVLEEEVALDRKRKAESVDVTPPDPEIEAIGKKMKKEPVD